MKLTGNIFSILTGFFSLARAVDWFFGFRKATFRMKRVCQVHLIPQRII
jgi:hypothetical protein